MRWTVLIGGLLCTACVSSLGNVEPNRTGRTLTYVGIVRVRMPAAQDGITYVDVKTLGLGWDGAAFLGWHAGQWVTADPAKCQLLVIVRSGVEADSAAALFKSLGEQRPCIADFRHTAGTAPPASSSPLRP